MIANGQPHARTALILGKKPPVTYIGPRSQSRSSDQEKNLLPVHSDLEFLHALS